MIAIKCLTVLLVIGSAMALKNGKQCDLNDAVKRCLTNGLLLETDRDKLHLPYNKNEMNQICERLKKSEKCAKDFVDNCADSSKEKLVLENSLEGAVRVLKRVCRTNTKKTEFLKNAPCGNAVVREGLQCMDNYKHSLSAAAKLTDKNQIMRIMCCKIRDIGPCIGDAMRSKGERVCSAKNIDYYRRVKQTFKEELTSVICADYERDTCTNVKVPAIDDSEVSASIVYPMKQILDRVF